MFFMFIMGGTLDIDKLDCGCNKAHTSCVLPFPYAVLRQKAALFFFHTEKVPWNNGHV
jgi:hypothetical protein